MILAVAPSRLNGPAFLRGKRFTDNQPILMKAPIFALFGFCLLVFDSTHSAAVAGGKDKRITVKSPAFAPGGTIPARYTCSGKNVSPALQWDQIPSGTRSICLICDDPDAPAGTWVHWVMFDIPDSAKGLPEGVPQSEGTAAGARQGKNDFGNLGYGGPCPPSGRAHRYFFRLYALDRLIGRNPGISRADLDEAMKGHILAWGELMGTFQR